MSSLNRSFELQNWKVVLGPKRSAIGLGLVSAMLCAALPYRPVMLVGDSMEPTYANGSWVWAHRYEGPNRTPIQRADLVVLESESGPIVKRVAYLPGEAVHQVHFVNWTDEFAEATHRIRSEQGMTRTIVVPPNMVYLRGDNPDQSVDSRHWGPVSMDRIRYVVCAPRPREFPPYPLAAR